MPQMGQIWGWDISTTCIGFSAFDEDGFRLIRVGCIEVGKVDGLLEKTAYVDKALKLIAENDVLDGEFTVHYVEDRLGGFSGGKTSQQTILMLAAFNHAVSYLVKSRFNWAWGPAEVRPLHVMTIKSRLRGDGLVIPKGSTEKKKITLDYVCSREPTFPRILNRNGKVQPYCYDMADSYVVARAGYLGDLGKV